MKRRKFSYKRHLALGLNDVHRTVAR